MNSTHHTTNPALTKSRRNLFLCVFLVMMISFLALSPSAFAAIDHDGGASSAADWCAVTNTEDHTRNDYSTCLPAGRWGSLVGTIQIRTEPYDGNIIGQAGNMLNNMAKTSMQIIPGAFMAITQICWSGTIALSQFAATFDPLDVAGARVDHAVAELINGSDGNPGLMQGSIPAAFVVLAILSLAVAAGFEIGTVKEASKRLLATVLCLAAIITMGAGAAKTGTNASTPATGSPWWVVRTINTTINKLTVNLNLDGLTNNSAMMAYDNRSISNCQDYLMAMHQQYDTNPNRGNSTSSITKAVNLLWEETALRSWVTMQYGNPQAGGNTSSKVAANAQQAYCHVLEMKANTNPEVQTSLTNKELGLSGDNIINNKTGSWIFDETGWISTLHSMVDDSDSTDDRDDAIMQDRAAIFWETCTAEGGRITAREGWKQLIKNLGDHPTYAIKNGKRVLRVANNTTDPKTAKSLQRTRPSEDNKLMSEDINQLCSSVLLPHNGIFQHSNDGPVAEVSEPKKSENGFIDTNLGDAATLGWRFDVPNVGGTWSEANLGNLSDSRTDLGGMKQTIDNLYGNSTSDWLGAFGSVVGGFCSLIVFGSLSLILIVSKLMLSIMGLFLIFALIIRAFPVGEKPKKILINWIKYTGNLGLTGMLYSALAVLATFICSITLDFCSGMASSFTYNVIAGISPVLALVMIGLFCSKVVKCGNPFSLKAMMNLAGGSALVSGIGRGMNIADRFRRNNFYKSMRNRGGRHASTGQYSSKNVGGVGQAVESQKIVEGASEAMQAAGAPNPPKTTTRTTAAGTEKPTFAERWATRRDNSLRTELGRDGTATKTAALFSKAGIAGKNILHPDDDRTADYAEKYLKKTPFISREELAKKVAHRQGLHNIATSVAGLGKAAGYGIAGGAMLAAGAVRSRTGRDLIKRGAKLAVTGGLTAAAFTNPLTAPLGLLAMGKLAASRDTWKLGGYVAKTTGKAAGHALGATGRALGAAGHFAGTQIGNGVSYLGRLDHSHELFLDPENTAPVTDNPFISEQYDPQTDEKLYTTDAQGHQTLTDFGEALQTQILTQKQNELIKQGLDPDEVNERMYAYQESGQLADDLYESAQRLTDVENGNTDPYYQEPIVDQNGEIVGMSTDRMLQPDGVTFTANGQRAVDEARNEWIRDYTMEHPDVGYDQAVDYLNQNPDVYMDRARQIFNEQYGYSGQGTPFIPPVPEEPRNSGTTVGTQTTTSPVASTAPALSTVLPPTPHESQPSTGETTTPLNPVTPTATGNTPSQDDVYTRTVVDQNGVPQATMIDPLWNKTGTAMTEQGQVAYDAAEQAFRQQQQAQGLSDEAIERKLDQADVQRNIMDQARKIYEQQNSPTQRIPVKESQPSQPQPVAQPQTDTQSHPVSQQQPIVPSQPVTQPSQPQPVGQQQPVIQPLPVTQSQPVQPQPNTQPLPPVAPTQQTPRVQSPAPIKPANPFASPQRTESPASRLVPPTSSTPQAPRSAQTPRTPLSPQPIPTQQSPTPQQPGSPHNPPVTPPTPPVSPTVAALHPHPLPNNKNTKGQ